MSFVLDPNGIISKEPISDKVIKFQIQGISLQTLEREILVWYKNSFHLKNIKEFGDGMTIFRIFDREQFIFDSFDKEACIMGMSIFQQFDEEDNKRKVYLYNFDKNKIDELNDIFGLLGFKECSAKIDKKFVILDGILPDWNEIEKNIINWISKNDIKSLISFVFGLNLVYGSFDLMKNSINGSKIYIPITQNLILKRGFFDQIFECFVKNGFFCKIDNVQKKMGYVLQVVIGDWEMIGSFANFLKKISGELIDNKYIQMMDFQKKLINYVSDNSKIVSILQHGVLKSQQK